MKKAAFFLAILLGITLCGCSGQKMDAAEPTEMTASESELPKHRRRPDAWKLRTVSCILLKFCNDGGTYVSASAL